MFVSKASFITIVVSVHIGRSSTMVDGVSLCVHVVARVVAYLIVI